MKTELLHPNHSDKTEICFFSTIYSWKHSSYFGLFLITLFIFYSSQSNAQGTWTQIAKTAPHGNGGTMLLLSDGTVIAKSKSGGPSGGSGTIWDKLTPDIHGSYINGTWTSIAPMNYDRLYFSSQVLKDGRVYIAGGEYGAGKIYSETYDPLTNKWTMCPSTGKTISDASSEILPDGRVLQAFVTSPYTSTDIYDPITNKYTVGPNSSGAYDEASWVKLPDNSILFVDVVSKKSERYIPSLNKFIADATLPVSLYDTYGDETGAGFMLPNGKAFFIGDVGNTAIYTPSGTTSPGTWVAGANIPDASANLGAPDAAAAMMVNGKILCALSPIPTSANHFPSPTTFYEYNYLTNTFTKVGIPGGGTSLNIGAYQTTMLDLPDGTVMYVTQGSTKYYTYSPAGTPLIAGKPTINNVIPNSNCSAYTITGTLFNGISGGAAYGDDQQMASNYPIIRLTSGTNVYYVRTFNWNSTGVQRGTNPDTTQFTLPVGLPAGTYSLVVTANGIASDPFVFTPGVPSLTSSLTPPAICSNTAFTYLPTGPIGATFSWTRPAVNGISNAAITSPQSINPNEVLINTTSSPISVVYNYSITNSCGNNQQSVTIVVNPSSSASIAGISIICLGDSTKLTASGGTNYVWSNNSSATSITVHPTSTTTYSVTATNSYGCKGMASQTITLKTNCTTGILQIGYEIGGNMIVYPNPAGNNVTLSYELSRNSNVEILVYDLLGKEIMQVVNEKQTSGEHRLNLNTILFQNGIYFVRMNVDGEQLTQKLIINK